MLVKDYMSRHPFMLEEVENIINQVEGQKVRDIRETA
jgi:hypothetical protein